MKRIPRTVRVRENILKTYYYLRATFKVESQESESYVFEQILLEGMEKVRELTEQGKTIMVSVYRGKRYVIGGNLSPETNERFTQLAQEFNWEIQECIEILIYFSSLERLTEAEQGFFGLDEIKIAVLDK
jgi:hypothetical protein